MMSLAIRYTTPKVGGGPSFQLPRLVIWFDILGRAGNVRATRESTFQEKTARYMPTTASAAPDCRRGRLESIVVSASGS